jgi:glycosyltransferase involved in cell wall biosynthesis
MLRLGKGDAVRKGFAAASGDILMILDADLTVPPEELPKFYQALVEGRGEFINGTRLVHRMEGEAMRLLNKIANKFFSMLFTWLLRQRIKDTLCVTKVLRRKDYEKIAADRGSCGVFDPFGDFELLFGAAKRTLRIAEVPVRYRKRTYGEVKIHRLSHGLLFIRMSLVAPWKLKFV